MKIRTLIVASAFALASGTAFASSCPKHMKAIDAALANSTPVIISRVTVPLPFQS